MIHAHTHVGRVSLACTFLAILSLPAFGQTFGEITGRVTDASSAAVPGATITLISVATNGIRTTVSTDSGDYTFPSVAPGFYNVKAEHQGFKTATSNNVEVQVQQTVRLDLALPVGQVTESVEVSALADLLQAENASVGTVIENKGVTELPLNGREYLNLVALAANVDTLSPASGQAGSREGGDRAAQSISAAGQRIMFDYFTLDGVNNTDPNFLSYIVLPSIDAIQEFKVQTGVYPAEFGHEATQINVLTKSGGNVYHGALFEFVRNDVFDAIPYAFTSNHPSKAPFKWNDFGFELDGPVRIPKLFNGRNRLFFMANDEWKLQRQNSQGLYTVPTAAMFQGNEAGLSTIYDPLTGLNGATKTPFPNNVIPSSRLDPISQKLLAYYPSSNLPGLSNNYVQQQASPQNRDGFTVRMDWIESAKSQWSGRYSWGTEDQESTGLSVTGSKIITNYDQYLGSNTRTITPTLVNEARYGYSRFYNSIGTLSAFTLDSVTPLGIPGLSAGMPVTWGVPSMTFSGDGFSALGDSSDGPYQNNNNTLQFVDNLSWIRGKHSFRFGFEYNRQNYNQVGNQFSRGQFTFQPNATQSSPNASGAKTGGDAFSEFLLGDIYTSTVAVAIASANFQRNAVAAFADDTWKITPKITLSLGLRYELTPPWTDLLNNDFTVAIPQIIDASNQPAANQPFFVREGNCSNVYSGLAINWTSTPAVCSNGKYPVQLMKTAYKNFAPRVGISWSPDSKTVIRTGFGIYYNQDIGNAVFDMARNIAARVSIFPSVAGQGLPWSQAAPAGQSGSGPAVAQVPPPYAYADAYDHATAYTMQFMFNVQRQLPGDWLLEAGYLGNESHHLSGFQDANQAPPSTVGTAVSRYPWADYGIIQLVQDGANGNYNSLSFKATRRFTKGLSVISSYTWSKSIDDTSGIRSQSYDVLFPQNSYCIACERALSAFDVRHRVVTSVLYDLPIGKGQMLNINNPLLNTVAGGWQAGGIMTLQTGLPGTLTIGGVDNSSTGEGGYDRPNTNGASPYLSNPTPSRYLSLAPYSEAPAGQFGNVGRNTIEGPGIFNIDFELHKQIRMPYNEHHSLQFRLEAFNVLNHANWSMPNLNILSGAVQPGLPATAAHQGFGVSTGTATSMRQVQLGLKYAF
jgi:Carboxypeptidase regulatory-like domain/TonB dependent receptor-like, beta-barrel